MSIVIIWLMYVHKLWPSYSIGVSLRAVGI